MKGVLFALYAFTVHSSQDVTQYKLSIKRGKLHLIGKCRPTGFFVLNFWFLSTSKINPVQHSFRTYHQVQQRLNEKKKSLEWGRKKIGEHLNPITTALSVAPLELLSLIVCACKDEYVRNWKCRKSHGCNIQPNMLIY
ncbi:unnamed protein product, partial [Brenthis ino]